MGTIICVKDTDDFKVPAECIYRAFDETEYEMYFESKEEAIHHAKLNECIVLDLITDEVVIDTLNKREE